MWSESIRIFNPNKEVREYIKKKRKYAKKVKWWQKILGYCPRCNRYFRYTVKTQRRNTQYGEESSNWITACEECRDDDFEYFQELWDYYNSSRL